MSITSFWNLPDVTSLKTPLSILKEQAEALTNQTKGTLVGEVEVSSGNSGNIFMNLIILVPSLNNYRFKVLRYRQPVTLYTGIFSSEIDGLSYEINNEEEFVSTVQSTLGSTSMQRIVGNLLSQAGSAL